MENLLRMNEAYPGGGHAVSYPTGYRRATLIKYGMNSSYHTLQGTGACLKNHSRHPHFLVRAGFTPDSDYIARYTGSYDASCPLGMRSSSGVNLPCHALQGPNCEMYLTESIFQTRSKRGVRITGMIFQTRSGIRRGI